MGRLDEHAKRRIVELRRAGLSFRKIRNVLERDDIRVTPQAVYLFLKRKRGEPAAASWHGGQPWHPQLAEPPRLSDSGVSVVPPGHPMGSWVPCSASSQDSKDGIRIVDVASLCKDGGEPGDTLPVGLAPGNGDDSSMGTLSPPLPSQGHPRNPVLLVHTVTADRAVLLQNKVRDASTQTALLSPLGQENPSLAWGVPVPPSGASPQAVAEKLDAVQTEVQKLSRALQVVLERQCQLERQQEQQQRLQQEVLVMLQQLSCTLSHGAVPATQPCGPFGSVAEPSPTVPNFSQFKVELM